MNEIEEFIHRRFPVDCNWMNGNCYFFAKILCTRFINLEIGYMPITGHFVAKQYDSEEYYDWTGRHIINDEEIIRFDEIKVSDPEWFFRLMRDCVY